MASQLLRSFCCVLIAYDADGNVPACQKNENSSIEAGVFLCIQAGNSSVMGSPQSDLTKSTFSTGTSIFSVVASCIPAYISWRQNCVQYSRAVIPVQCDPFPWCPVLHVQENDPWVFWHVASMWQLWPPSVHSLISENERKWPETKI